MAILANAIKKDFLRIHKDVDSHLVYKGKSIACLYGSTDDDPQLAPDGGGEMQIYDLTATVRKSDFYGGSLPKKGETVYADGVEYQLGRPNSKPGSPLMKLYFSNLDQ